MKITFPTQHEIGKLCSYMNINSVVRAQVHRTYKYKAILEDIVCEYHENYLSNIDISKFPKT